MRSEPLFKPNYSFEKRQKELAKQKKKEEKKKRKLEKKNESADPVVPEQLKAEDES